MRLAHEVDKLTTLLYSPLPQVHSTRPKKTCLIREEGGEGSLELTAASSQIETEDNVQEFKEVPGIVEEKLEEKRDIHQN